MEARHPPTRLRFAILGLYVLLLASSAWMHDDAYITFRSIDNLLHGHGLTWNPGERVQAYTHPLWMLLHAALFALTRETYLTSLVLSMVLSVATFALLIFRLPSTVSPNTVSPNTVSVTCVVGFLLVSCKSFVEYSTSGLENPLTHLLLVIFVLRLLHNSQNGESAQTLFVLSGTAALAAVNRPDTLLLYLPALVFVLLRHKTVRHLLAAAAGFLPLALWELFSLIYYGFLLPNTAYAKLGIGAPRVAMLEQGFYYLLYSLVYDPMTWLLLASAVYAAFRLRLPDRRLEPLLAGCGLYLAYVVWIGGDYMGGRFLSAPLLGAAMVVACAAWPRPSKRQMLAGLAVVSLLLARSATVPLTGKGIRVPGVGDERLRFYHATGLLNGAFSDRPWLDHFFRHKGDHVRRNGPPVIVDAYVGFLGYHAGPKVHIVDLLGLPDPLLARLPGRLQGDTWTPGHVPRPLPEGYLESLRSGENRIVDPSLAAYYDKLRLVTRGDLWTAERWLEIWRFHSGANAALVKAYVRDNPRAFSAPPKDLRTLFTVDSQQVIEGL